MFITNLVPKKVEKENHLRKVQICEERKVKNVGKVMLSPGFNKHCFLKVLYCWDRIQSHRLYITKISSVTYDNVVFCCKIFTSRNKISIWIYTSRPQSSDAVENWYEHRDVSTILVLYRANSWWKIGISFIFIYISFNDNNSFFQSLVFS